LRSTDGERGLDVQYFSGVNFDTPKDTLLDKNVDHDWPGPPLAGPPGGLDGFNNFSARWEGFLIAPESGEYEIGIDGDDGFRLFLDGKKVIEDWNSGAVRYKNTMVTLKKGEKVSLKLEFYQGAGERALRLAWRTPADMRDLEEAKNKLNLAYETYLPQGANWFDFWNNQPLGGGQTVTRDCPLNIMPLYIRAGSIVPMGPVMQYATEKPDAPYEIRIYPGADASFTIYEDDNETYDYEKGEYATYDLVWDDAAKTLSIGPRSGSFAGMVKERELNVVLALPEQNAGIETATSGVKPIKYTGKPVQVQF